jgi:hypothetical protein
MTSFSLAHRGVETPVSAQARMMRKPQRICATVSWQVAQKLQERADYEGRSLSNLIAYLLEAATPE